jgi:amino-acid N-acetyltransferase
MTDRLDAWVDWFRHSSPFIHAHRGRTFVISVGGEALSEGTAAALIHDLALLNGLGIRLVLVPGARPQIEERLNARGAAIRYANGLRVTDAEALGAVVDAVGSVRLAIEALFSMGLANSPMAGLRLQVASGNFVTARPLGVRDGVDHLHTGEVRRIDSAAVRQRLDDGAVVLMSPLGVSPTGEQFNLYAEDVAVAAARSLQADKLLFIHEGEGLVDADGAPLGELTLEQARERFEAAPADAGPRGAQVNRAIAACRGGVPRVHLLPRQRDGALLGELFSRDGVGTLITPRAFERLRPAGVEDINGILALVAPLEDDGTLVRRTRERIETAIGDFTVMDREGTVVACAALHRLTGTDAGEIAGLVVHPDYRDGRRGRQLLDQLERDARAAGCRRLFALTTRTVHWFREQGFAPVPLETLPAERRAAHPPGRGSKVLLKALD